MRTKPKTGQRVMLLAHAQRSRAGFSLEVEVLDAHTQADSLNRTLRPRAEKLEVHVRLPNGDAVWVQRGDLLEISRG